MGGELGRRGEGGVVLKGKEMVGFMNGLGGERARSLALLRSGCGIPMLGLRSSCSWGSWAALG